MKTTNSNKAASITLKAVIIGVLVLIMLIPVTMLKEMIRERMEYSQEVEAEIGSSWGGQQIVTGPILVLPYERQTSEKETEKGRVYFLPETLQVNGDLETEVRSRTAHDVLLYKSDLNFSGKFAFPDLAAQHLKPEHIRWEEAAVYIGIRHLQGVQNQMAFQWNGAAFNDINSTTNPDLAGTGLTLSVPIDTTMQHREFEFQFDLALNGTSSIQFSPVGKQTTVKLNSDWETVSFTGKYLPGKRDFENGFTAEWNIFDFNHLYPQSWKNGALARANYDSYSPLEKSAFGADLRFKLDHYQLSMRSVKYAIMFIALTFFVFFLVEVLSDRRIHPIQYLLVSCGLVLFYSLLLALSEHIGFNWAYLVSAVAIITLITTYSSSIFKSRKQTMLMALFLTTLYVYLFVMLQLEDMALLFGSIGLFIALAIIMYVSRKVNWYKTPKAIEEHPDTPEDKQA